MTPLFNYKYNKLSYNITIQMGLFRYVSSILI